jgi:Ca-activated chloride channel family protein
VSWGSISLLGLLVAVASLLALRWWWAARLRRVQSGVGAGVAHLTGSVGQRRGLLRLGLLWSGLALGVVALAGPRWGSTEQVRAANGADVLIVLDCSRSMLATDLYPTRLATARRKALDLLRLAPETRLALMPFAALPVLRCPLTGDHEALATMLEDCSSDLFPAEAGYQGTAIGSAVKEGLGVLGRQVERGQAILVMSDGADEDATAVQAAADAAKAAGVPVYGLFLGDTERTVSLRIDGKDEVMSADRSTLDRLATATGAVSVNATTTDDDVRALVAQIGATVAQRPWEERHRQVASERYRWFLVPAILLVAAGALLGTRRKA